MDLICRKCINFRHSFRFVMLLICGYDYDNIVKSVLLNIRNTQTYKHAYMDTWIHGYMNTSCANCMVHHDGDPRTIKIYTKMIISNMEYYLIIISMSVMIPTFKDQRPQRNNNNKSNTIDNIRCRQIIGCTNKNKIITIRRNQILKVTSERNHGTRKNNQLECEQLIVEHSKRIMQFGSTDNNNNNNNYIIR